MTIQATITTLTLGISLISSSWTLAADEPAAGHPVDAVPLQLEAQPLVFPGARPTLPIQTVARRIVADPLQGFEGIRQEGPAPMTWRDPAGTPLPFQNDSEILDFLRTARIVSQKRVGVGINKISKVLLEKDGVELHAAFRKVSISKPRARLAVGNTLGFRDDCRFEVAAYRLSKLLGLDNVPPVVKRKIGGVTGTLQVWVENAMMEKERSSEKLQAPSKLPWTYQWQTLRLFDSLIDNDDRNAGNILIDSDWKLWMIDHTRAFGKTKKLRNPQLIRQCRRGVWERLQELDPKVLKEGCKKVLTGSQIKALMARRDLLVQHIQKLIDERGEGQVLFSDF